MGKDILIRGFDEKTYSVMNDLAKKKGVTITSFIKNVIDQRLKEQEIIQKKHDIILYDDDESLEFLIKSLDRLTKDAKLFKSFCATKNSNLTKIFMKLRWFDGTIYPQEQDIKKLPKYLKKIIDKVSKNSDKQLVCFMDCILENVAETSTKKALSLENEYNNGRLAGLTFCTYKVKTIMKNGVSDMLEILNAHDQVFVLKEDEIFKMHITKENTQKLLLD